jgi:hypothetical protein
MSCWVSVREGRASHTSSGRRDRDWGKELMAFDSDEPVSIGARVLLPDGCIVPIVDLVTEEVAERTTYIAVVGD